MRQNNTIALINPPSPFLIKERVFPNLGLVQLATSMKENGEEVELFDFCGVDNAEERIRQIAHDFEFFGFSSTSPQFIHTSKLNSALKQENPRAFTVLGGAHASAMHSFILNSEEREYQEDPNVKALSSFDRVVVGEGDRDSRAIFDREGPHFFISDLIKDLDSLPYPDRSLIDIHSYKYSIGGREDPATTIMSQRGCPFKCDFCCGRDIPMYKRARVRSPEKVLEELDYLNKEFGFKSFMWFDDEININPKRLTEISKLLKNRDYAHRGFVRSDLLLKFPDTLDALVDAGFIELCSGFEFGSRDLLKRVHKGITPEQNAEAGRRIMDKGLRYKCFGIIGGPGETYEDVMETKKWLQEVKPDAFDLTILSPYPGSKIYDDSKPSNKYPGFDREWNGLYFKRVNFSEDETFFKGIPGQYHCSIRTDSLSSKDLLKLRGEMETELRSR